jgi:hypothetical protein
MYRVKVFGPSASPDWGMDILVVDSPEDVSENNGVLMVKCVGQPSRPHPNRAEEMLPEIRSSVAIYPRGGWTKAVINDVVVEGELP